MPSSAPSRGRRPGFSISVSEPKPDTSRPLIDVPYEKAIEAQRKRNLEDVRQRRNLKSGVTEERLLKDAKECGYSSVDVYWNDVVLKLPPLLRVYAKDPVRQQLFEPLLQKCLERALPDLLPNLVNLPNGGPGALRFVEGSDGKTRLVKGYDEIGQIGKTLDFVSYRDDCVIVFMHKYTRGRGGSQDNQAADMLGTLAAVRRNKGSIVSAVPGHKGKPVILIALGDGDYYQNERHAHPMSSMKEAAQECRRSGVAAWACASSDLGQLLGAVAPLKEPKAKAKALQA